MKVSVSLDEGAVIAVDRAASAAGVSRAEVIRGVLGEWMLTGGGPAPISRVAELRADFDALGWRLGEAEGSAAASLARERRLIGEQLESLEKQGGEISVVDELAKRRNSAATARVARRGGKSG